MHNHEDKGMKWMMYLMMLCCMVPLLILVAGARQGVNWWVIGAISIFVVLHFVLMKKHGNCHGDHKKEDNDRT